MLEAQTTFLMNKLKLEEKIKQERDNLYNLFHSMADAVLVINDEHIIEFMNQTAISYFEDQIGNQCFKFLCGHNQPCTFCPLLDIENSSQGQNIIHCQNTFKGRLFEIKAAPLIRDNQKKAIVEIVRDITKEKELEQKLLISEKKYCTLVSHSRDLILVQDLQGTILFVSESIEKIMGYQVDEVCFKPFRQFLTENPINDPWRKQIQDQEDLQRYLEPHLLECKTKHGGIILLEANESEIISQDSQEKQIMGIYRDITKRKRLEDQLLKLEKLRLSPLTRKFRCGEIIGRNPKMQEIYETIKDVSQSKATVLIQGESGTGKELVARAIHYQGLLASKPFIGVSCSVLSENLLESELFGHVKGAFTGAIKDKTGRFELANGGTLFLDEIADMSLNLQTKLLRVLQEREFEKVGGEKTIKVDVRIIAATNKDVKEEVARGRFREDLYYRLKVVEIKLPPLRERIDDLPLLAMHFIEKFNQKTGKKITGLSREAMRILFRHSWPGNIRELEHLIEHAFVKCKGLTIQPRHLPQDLLNPQVDQVIKVGMMEGLSRDQIDKEVLLSILEECDWNLKAVMQKLDISRPTLWRKMKKYGLSKKLRSLCLLFTL
ncbi:MAG: sigma 54-interacting transcriptional regulator [bacterium]|nr:sigma 54-interacting transcriptional regulator [bacterium]